MEEDNQAPKQDIFYFLYGKSYAQRPLFHKLRFQFIRSMRWRTWVSPEECEEVGVGSTWDTEGQAGQTDRGVGLTVGGGIEEREDLRLDRERAGWPPGLRPRVGHCSANRFTLQIQAYNPDLWVWSRDRTKLT